MAKTIKPEKEKKKIMVHIALSEDERDNLDKWRQLEGITRTDFIRISISERIRMLEHPESFKASNDYTGILQQIYQTVNLIQEKQGIIDERTKAVNGRTKALEGLKEVIETTEVENDYKLLNTLLETQSDKTLNNLKQFFDNNTNRIYAIASKYEEISINLKNEVEKLG